MRPRDPVTGLTERAAHIRLPHDILAQLLTAGVVALATDSRSAIWTPSRKLAVCGQVIDRVVDGDKIPSWVGASDIERPENHALRELWNLAERAVAKSWASHRSLV